MYKPKTNFQETIVLIVDDAPLNLQVLEGMLGSANIPAIKAQNGKEGIEFARLHRPDLILLDIMMPQMDGFQACEKLKDDPETENIPIIFLTAKNQTEDVLKGLELGAVDYITKPFNPKELLSRVKNQLELKKAHDIILEQNEKLAELNATKDKFFSIIAHDLKNPFGDLIGFSELLIQSVKKDNKQRIDQYSKIIYETSERGHRLLENLLQWSRSQRDTIKWNPQKTNLKDMFLREIELLKSRMEKKNIQLNTELPDALVTVDINMISTVIRNLLTNAVKFTPEQGTITIRERIENDKVTIAIKDTGIGIPKENLPKLFRIDEHHTTPGTNNEEGTGLGLIICKEFIEKHNGKIQITSELGKGTEVSFLLPLTLT